MKPKLLFTIASVLYLLSGITAFFLVSGFDYSAYTLGVTIFALGVLFWLTRNAPASKSLDAVFITGFLSTFGWALVSLYSQWSGNYMDSPIGYVSGLLWLGLAVWFFLAGRANMSKSAS